MQFLGFVWITCCLSGLFSSNQDLLNTRDYWASNLSAKALSVLSNQLDLSHRVALSGLSTKPQSLLKGRKHRSESKPKRDRGYASNVTTATVKSKRSRKRLSSELNWVNPLTAALMGQNRSQKQVCLSESPETLQIFSGLDSQILPEDKTPEHPESFSFFPNESEHNPPSRPVGRFLQKVLAWQRHIEPTVKTQPKTAIADSVKVVPVNRSLLEKISVVDEWHHQQQHVWQNAAWDKTVMAVMPFKNPSVFQVWVKGYSIAELPNRVQADLLAHRIEQLLQDSDLDPSQIQPTIVGGFPAGQAGDRLLFVINPELANSLDLNRELLAIEWINNLRTALSVPPLSIVEAQAQMHGLVETKRKIKGTASWYGPYFHGRLTATGETFDQQEFTAAHPSLPFDTYLKVKNLHNGQTLIVRINDRGPYIPPRSLDLSLGAARSLGSEEVGVISYEAVLMKKGPSADSLLSEL